MQEESNAPSVPTAPIDKYLEDASVLLARAKELIDSSEQDAEQLERYRHLFERLPSHVLEQHQKAMEAVLENPPIALPDTPSDPLKRAKFRPFI